MKATPEQASYIENRKARQWLEICKSKYRGCRSHERGWRKLAEKGREYYFGRQLDEADAQVLADRKQPDVVFNYALPLVRALMMIAISNIPDWQAHPIGRDDDRTAEVVTGALKYVDEVNYGSFVRSQISFDRFVYGVGWVLVGRSVRSIDPRDEPAQFMRIPPDQVSYDWRITEPSGSELNFAIITRRVIEADLIQAFPGYRQQIMSAPTEDEVVRDVRTDRKTSGGGEYNGFFDFIPPVKAWDAIGNGPGVDYDRPQSRLVHQIYDRLYKTFNMVCYRDGFKRKLSPGESIGEVMMDPMVSYIAPMTAPYIVMTQFVDDAILSVEIMDDGHDQIPLIPFFYEMDEAGCPVSFMRALLDPSDMVNKRHSRAMALLLSPKYLVNTSMIDFDDEEDEESLAEKLATPGSVIKVSGPDAISVIQEPDSAQQQMSYMEGAIQSMHQIASISPDLMGIANPNSRSAVSKQESADQSASMQMPGEFHSLVQWERCGYMLSTLIAKLHTEEWHFAISDDIEGQKVFVANKGIYNHESGEISVANDIQRFRANIKLGTRPYTPTRRIAESQQLVNLAQNNNDPSIKPALEFLALQTMETPRKREMLRIYQEAWTRSQQQLAQAAAPANPQQAA